MSTLVSAGLGNAIGAAVLAALALLAGRYCRRPALVHSLWLLVLIKLITPPLVRPPVAWLPPGELAPAPHSAPAAPPPPVVAALPAPVSDSFTISLQPVFTDLNGTRVILMPEASAEPPSTRARTNLEADGTFVGEHSEL